MALVARVGVDDERADEVLDVLLTAGADEVELVPGEVLGLFHESDADELGVRLSGLLAAQGLPVPAVEVARMLDWDSVWAGAVRPFRVGPLQFAPGGEPGEGRIAFELGAFGSGLHPSTRLCIERLVEHPPRGSVLDVGAGTGILALAALRLGAQRAVGIDTDPEALAVARRNAERNGLTDRLEVVSVGVAALQERFDRVLANLVAASLEAMADELVGLVASGGELSLAGFRSGQADEVARAFTRRGMRWIHSADSEGWARVDLAPTW